MVTIPVRIILHGLIALVPQYGSDANIKALLVDTYMRPTEAKWDCIAPHTPEIEFPTSSLECTDVQGCEYKEGVCACKLGRQEIALVPSPQRKVDPPEEVPLSSLPFDSQAAADLRYVANLSRLKYSVDASFLDMDPQKTPPRALAARFKFPFETAAACGLATRHDGGADYAHALNLRPLETQEQADEVGQVMAQRVETTLGVEIDESGGEVLKLILTPFHGEKGESHEFKLTPPDPSGPSEVRIDLSNDRPHFMIPDQICDDGIGRDFAYFYELVANKPTSWADRLIPHLKYGLRKSVADLFPPPLASQLLCIRDKAPMSSPICPMASFNP